MKIKRPAKSILLTTLIFSLISMPFPATSFAQEEASPIETASESMEPQAALGAYAALENGTTAVSGSPFDSLQEAVSACISQNPSGNFTVILSADDLSLGPRVTIPSTLTITLISDGTTRTITQQEQSNTVDEARHFIVLGVLNLENITLTGMGDAATAYNGGVYVAESGQLTMNNSKIENCYGQNGGGLHADTATVVMNGSSSISSNRATSSLDSPGGVYLRNAELTMNNTSSIDSNSSAASNGGGVFASSGSTVSLISDASVSNNFAFSGGGGIYLSESEMVFNDGLISGNEASVGGGILLATSTLEMYGGAISNNINIYRNLNAATGAGVGVGAASTFNMHDGKISDNSADTNAGGVYIHTASSGTTATFNMYGGEISGNVAKGLVSGTGYGGGVYVPGVSDYFNMYGGQLFGNQAYIGGGIYGTLGKINIDSIAGSTPEITENRATYGAGIYTNNVLDMAIRNATLDGNMATTRGGGLYYVYSGATSSTLTLENVTVTNNRVDQGFAGGIYMYQNPTSSFSNVAQYNFANCTFSNNSASQQAGGLYIVHGYSTAGALVGSTDASYNFTGTTFEGNSAGLQGGGIFLSQINGVGEYNFTESILTQNTSSSGGAAYFETSNPESHLNFNKTNVVGNSATEYGGGLYLNNGELEYSGGLVSENKAGLQGGGLYLDGQAVFTMLDSGSIAENTTIIGNEADLSDPSAAGDDLLAEGSGGSVTLLPASLMPTISTENLYWTYDTEGARYRNGDSIGTYTPSAGDTSSLALTLGKTYDINYDANGGTGSYSDSVDSSSTYTVLSDQDTMIAREGYIFTDWNTSPAGTGDSYTPGVSYTLDSSITLFAQWSQIEPETASISYDANGGIGSYADVVPAGTNYTIATQEDTGITYKGYTFIGWNTQADGSGDAYAPGDSYTAREDLILYAQWNAIPPSPTPIKIGEGKTVTAKTGDLADPAIWIGLGSLAAIVGISTSATYRVRNKRE